MNLNETNAIVVIFEINQQKKKMFFYGNSFIQEWQHIKDMPIE